MFCLYLCSLCTHFLNAFKSICGCAGGTRLATNVLTSPSYLFEGFSNSFIETFSFILYFFLILPKDLVLQAPVHVFIFKGTSIIVLRMLGRFLEVKHMCVSAKFKERQGDIGLTSE